MSESVEGGVGGGQGGERVDAGQTGDSRHGDLPEQGQGRGEVEDNFADDDDDDAADDFEEIFKNLAEEQKMDQAEAEADARAQRPIEAEGLPVGVETTGGTEQHTLLNADALPTAAPGDGVV